jgi:hypothetical protein
MLVKLTTNLGSNDFPGMPYLDGETHEVSDTVGAKLVSQSLAVEIVPEPPASVVVAEESAPKPDKFQKIRAENKTSK